MRVWLLLNKKPHAHIRELKHARSSIQARRWTPHNNCSCKCVYSRDFKTRKAAKEALIDLAHAVCGYSLIPTVDILAVSEEKSVNLHSLYMKSRP